MTKVLNLKRSLVVVFVYLALPLNAQMDRQAPPPSTVIPFSDGGVTFEAIDPGERPTYAEYSTKLAEDEDPIVARGSTTAAELSNSTNKNILVLTLIWTWHDSSGVTRNYTLREDHLFLLKGPIYPPGRRLVFPSVIWRYARNGSRASVMLDDKELSVSDERFEGQTPVSLELDTVILEDGTVLGPDKSKTMELLNARKQAIEVVSRPVLELLDRQKDPTRMLTDYAEKATDLSDPLAFWCARVARMYLAETNQRAIAAKLSTVPSMNLHR